MKTKNKYWILSLALLLAAPANAANWEYPQAPAQASAPMQTGTLAPTVTAPPAFFTISKTDVEKAVAEQVQVQAPEGKSIRAVMDPGINPTLYTAGHPLKIRLQALQIDSSARRWQAQAYIIGNSATETIRPVSGRYETMVAVPVVTRQFSAGDVIEKSDITLQQIPERQLRKDTITDANIILGKSPKRMISANRPIRATEIAEPVVVKKGQMVEMTYTTPGVHIRDQGEALEDGSVGSIIRVKNTKTGRAITARVEGQGHVETNTQKAM